MNCNTAFISYHHEADYYEVDYYEVDYYEVDL